jgi:membrane fusion protein, multidrug efflux system
MKSKTSIIKKALFIIIPLAIIAAFVIRLKTNKKASEQRVYQYDKEQAINVFADTLKLTTGSSTQLYSGLFQPNKETKLSSELQGKVNRVFVDLGNYVQKGQSLIQLDNSLLELQLKTIDVQIEGLEADLKRYNILVDAEAAKGIQLEKVELGLKSANLQRAIVLDKLKKTIVKAPFSGIVTAKLTEEGGFAAPGMPLLQITDISKLKFTINVPEKDISQFNTDVSYSISVDAFPDINMSEKPLFIGSKANKGNSFPIQFMVKNTIDKKIKSGMFGKVSLENIQDEKSLIITTSSIQGSNENPKVYVIKDGVAVLKEITISRKINNQAIISSGLNEGDVIITKGFINLFEGANVIVK